ncbi:unnamed protein product [Allacma fusca]|uniref:WH1 domain-containing protein n=1 Tax=Allacma fusca TaxID=39272 RepID=A0A8J2LH69_9HEXA|nr:unnamed protein product [Allacma fusca]
MMSNRLSGDEKSFRHYTSTPHLDTFRGGNTFAGTKPMNYGSNIPNPYQSTFSTFAHHKSGVDLRYRDDPNPYKVSTIDEFRIKVQDPYKTSRPNHGNQGHYASYYPEDEGEPEPPESVFRRLSIKYESPQYYHHSSNSGSSGDCEYEIPDPDYEGSTAGSSDDLPIPEPLVLTRATNADSCEEYSISISASEETTSATHSSPSPITITKISDSERAKVEHAFKGRKTSVYVADSLTNLYYMKRTSAPPRPNSTGSNGSGESHGSSGSAGSEWVLKYTGVLVLLLDTGETKNRDKRQIQIALAELGSGLALWKDVVDNLTSYKVTPESPSFHTMHLSSDHTIVVGFSFDDEDSADKFFRRIDKLTSDFANISLSGSKNKNKKEKKVKAVKFIKPKKTEISQPCGFQHIASVTSQDRKLCPSLQEFVSSGGEKSSMPLSRPVSVHDSGSEANAELHL